MPHVHCGQLKEWYRLLREIGDFIKIQPQKSYKHHQLLSKIDDQKQVISDRLGYKLKKQQNIDTGT